MPNRKRQTATTVVVNAVPKSTAKAQKKKKKNPSSKRQRPQGGAVPRWMETLLDPFDTLPSGIPDINTAASMKSKSRAVLNIPTHDGTSSQSGHGMILGVLPVPFYSAEAAATGKGVVMHVGYNSGAGLFGTNTSANFVTFPALLNIPNSAAIWPLLSSYQSIGVAQLSGDQYQTRCTALEVRITPQVTELNRAGQITVLLMDPDEISSRGDGVPSNTMNPFNLAFGSLTGDFLVNSGTTGISAQQMRGRCRRVATTRNPDGSVVARWLPTIVPQYGPLIRSTVTPFAECLKGAGPVLFIMIENDTTTASGLIGNSYQFDIQWHHETIGASDLTSAIPLTPSPYDSRAMEYVINKVPALSVESVQTLTGQYDVPDGRTGPASWSDVWDSAAGAYEKFNQHLNTGYGRTAMGMALRGLDNYRQGNRRNNLLMYR